MNRLTCEYDHMITRRPTVHTYIRLAACWLAFHAGPFQCSVHRVRQLDTVVFVKPELAYIDIISAQWIEEIAKLSVKYDQRCLGLLGNSSWSGTDVTRPV